MASAFQSAGQRCSALRVLFVQEDIADAMLAMLAGAMDELRVGDPGLLSTDVGPVIDAEAQGRARRARRAHAQRGRLIHVGGAAARMPTHGTFFAPRAYRDRLDRTADAECSARCCTWCAGRAASWTGDRGDQRDRLRPDARHPQPHRRDVRPHRVAAPRVGNLYVNRNQIGAVVGVQPFGGEGLCGTGPKAGGPHYLPRFATEQTVTVNTTAAGGNARLLAGG